MRKIILFSIIYIFSITAIASQCDVFGRINDAGLGDNPQFWEEFAQLSARGDVPEAQVARLMEKYKPGAGAGAANEVAQTAAVSAHAPRAILAGTQRVNVHRNAEKAYARAPVQVQHKADELTALFNQKGAAAIQDLKHHNWNYEYIDGHKKHSVRLSGGYRAFVTIEGDKLTIWDIGKNIYQH